MTTHSPVDAKSDMRFAMAAKALYAVSRVALPPLTLAHVGLAEYGLWAACFVIVSYLGMTASGFALVYLRRTAQHMAEGDVAAISRLLSTGIFTMASLGVLLLGGLWAGLPHLLALFKVDPNQLVLAQHLWLGACAIFLADLSLGAFGNVLHAIGRVKQEQKVWVASFLLETACIVLFLLMGMGIHGLLLAFAVRYALACSVNGWLVMQAVPGLQIRLRYYDRGLLRHFFGAGTVMQASGLLASALHSADKVIAGAAMGPAATAVFDLATKLPVTAASAPSGVSGVAVSAAARADAQRDAQAVRKVYVQALNMTQFTLGLMLPFMAALAGPITTLWLGPSATQAEVAAVMSLLCLSLSWHMLTGPATAISRGVGQLGAEYVYHGLRLALYGMAAAAWVWLLGAQGTWQLAAALALAQAAAASVYLIWSWRRVTGAWIGAWRHLVLPMAAAQILALGLMTLVQQGHLQTAWPSVEGRLGALLQLIPAGAIWLVAYGALAWWLLFDASARAVWRNRFMRPSGHLELAATQAPVDSTAPSRETA